MILPYGLGRRISPLDIKNYRLTDFIPPKKLDTSGSRVWEFLADPLDQSLGMPVEKQGHCPGFCLANFGINLPIQDNFTNADAHRFYYMCKDFDNEPGMENGSCMLSVAKTGKQLGLFGIYAFAQSIDEVSWWILNRGPVMVGTDWTIDMFTPDENNIIHPTGDVAGGHAYLLNEKNDAGYYHKQGSWNGWGIHGGAYISIEDFAILFRHGGEVIAVVEQPQSTAPDPKKSCITVFTNLFKGQYGN